VPVTAPKSYFCLLMIVILISPTVWHDLKSFSLQELL
jgi:hypothetical protein